MLSMRLFIKSFLFSIFIMFRYNYIYYLNVFGLAEVEEFKVRMFKFYPSLIDFLNLYAILSVIRSYQ